jgi:hypothetical protein
MGVLRRRPSRARAEDGDLPDPHFRRLARAAGAAPFTKRATIGSACDASEYLELVDIFDRFANEASPQTAE